MKHKMHLWVPVLWGASIVLSLSCSGNGANQDNPLFPDDAIGRQGMFFFGAQTLFGDANTAAADVDLASVVWGEVSAGGGSGDIVVFFEDGSSWVVAVAIQATGETYFPTRPYVRFLDQNNDAWPTAYPVSTPYKAVIHPLTGYRACSLPKVDCTYLGNGYVEIVVAFRYGLPAVTWQSIQATWDVRVTKLHFRYIPWIGWGEYQAQEFMNSPMMAVDNYGETHPDICYDQATGDIYAAWTKMHPNEVEMFYARHDAASNNTTWAGPYSLEDGTDWDDFDPYYVSLDVGVVAWPDESTERVVAFAYTGLFDDDSGDWWGFRPIIGWWNIDYGPDDDAHEPLYRLVHPDYDPTDSTGSKYDAGLVKVDIPGDNAPGHAGAVVFVQDICDPETGTYQVYGGSSLDSSGYTWISDPGNETFDEATWPSLAVYNSSGDTASVTYMFAELDSDEWYIYATQWDLEAGAVADDPTAVYGSASGEFSLDINELMLNNFGSASSLVDMDDGNNMYWAAWSDRIGEEDPNTVRGCVGYAEP